MASLPPRKATNARSLCASPEKSYPRGQRVSAPAERHAADFLLLAPEELFGDASECISLTGSSSSLQTLYGGSESLGKTAEEAKLIFSAEVGARISCFVEDYISLLIAIYQYEQRVMRIANSISDAGIAASAGNERIGHMDKDEVEKIYRRLDASYVWMIDEGTLDKATGEIRLC